MIASASSGTTSQTTCSMISRESLAMASYSGPRAASADIFWATTFDIVACAVGATGAKGDDGRGAGAGATAGGATGAGAGAGAGMAGRAWTGGAVMEGTPIMVRLVTCRCRPGDCGRGAGAGAMLAAGAMGRLGSRGAPGRIPGISDGRRLGDDAGDGAGAGARIGGGAGAGAGRAATG